MKVVMPAERMAWIDSVQRTRDVSCACRSWRTASAVVSMLAATLPTMGT